MRALAMLRRRHIAVLWTGLCLSCIGDYFYLVAVMWTAQRLAGSAGGLVAACQSGAALACAPFGGLLADRVDRRRAMITADLVRAVAVGALAVLTLRGGLGIAPLVAVAIVLGSSDAVFTPSLLSSIPRLVDHPGELQATNGLIDVTRRLARAIGPGLAGLVATFVSIGAFFALDAVSFCASAIAVLSMGAKLAWRNDAPPSSRGAPSSPSPRDGRVRGVIRGVREGVRAVQGKPHVVWGLATLFLVNTTWCAGFQWGGVLFTSRVLSVGMGGYGFLIGAYGVGNVLGNLVIANIHIERRVLTVFASRLVLCVGFLVLAAAPSLPVAMLGAAIAAIGGPMGELPFIAILQTEIPAKHTGRVFGLRMMIEHAGVAAGLVLSAPLFAVVPVRVGIAGCALVLGAGGAAGIARFGTKR